jgi:hypothetical protein
MNRLTSHNLSLGTKRSNLKRLVHCLVSHNDNFPTPFTTIKDGEIGTKFGRFSKAIAEKRFSLQAFSSNIKRAFEMVMWF